MNYKTRFGLALIGVFVMESCLSLFSGVIMKKTRIKKVIEDTFEVESVEDGGAARIANLQDGHEDGCLFIRVQSWDEHLRHEEFRELEGKKVRITIEAIE